MLFVYICWFHRLQIIVSLTCIFLSCFLLSASSCCFYTFKLVFLLVSIWRSGLGLLMAKFRQFLTEFSSRHMSVSSFPDHNFSKYQRTFTKHGMCIDIIEISLGLIVGKFHQFSAVICSPHDSGRYYRFMSKETPLLCLRVLAPSMAELYIF